MAKRKCVICNEWIEDETQSIPYKGRYAHTKCFNIAMKTIKKDKDEKQETYMTEGMCLGLCIGAALGGAALSVGMLIGLVVGMLIKKE